jgi:hypothetical protein
MAILRDGLVMVAVGVLACSSSKSTNPGSGTGGVPSGGAIGSSGGAVGSGGAIGSGGATGNPDGSTAEVFVDPGTALCPTAGSIMPGTSASPLPDDVEVLTSVSSVRFVAASDTAFFWSDQRTIHRVDASSGAETVILDRSTAGNSMQGLAVDGDTVYFGEAGIMKAFGVARVAATGGAATTIVPGNSMWQVTVADGYVYYYDAGLQEIGRVPVAGGTPQILVRDVDPAGPLAVANGYVYFVHPRTNFDQANVLRVPITAMAPPSTSPDVLLMPVGAEVVAPGDNYAADGVAANQTTLYFDDANRVMMVPLAGGAASQIYQAPDKEGDFGLTETTRIGHVLPANGKVYWTTDAGRCSDVMWSSSDGSSVGSRVHGVFAPGGLVANATHLYFLSGGKQLLRIPL